MQFECLPLGGGDALRVFPDGAYVPNAWINQATDSVGNWRKGTDKERICVLRVASESVVLNAEREKTRQANKDTDTMRISRDEFETLYNTEHAANTQLSIQVGKRGTMVLALGLTTALFVATTVLLALPSP